VGVASNTSPGDGAREFHVAIDGAKVDGDVYGQTVRLDGGAQVRTVFAADLKVGKAKYRSLQPFPSDLPRATRPREVKTVTNHFIVYPETKAVLSGNPSRVDVGDRATLVVPVGEHYVDELRLGNRSRLESSGPSRLMISTSFTTGRNSYVGTINLTRTDSQDSRETTEREDVGQPTAARSRWLNRDGLNLSIVVTGANRRAGFPNAVIGEGSRIHAIVAVPSGTLSLRNGIQATGTFYGKDVLVGAGTAIEHPAGLGFQFDKRCLFPVCEIDAVAGGTIKWNCSLEPLPAGTVCDDGNACTGPSTCTSSGVCQAGPTLPPPTHFGNCQNQTCNPEEGWFPTKSNVCNAAAVCEKPAHCNIAGFCEILGATLPPGTPCDDNVSGNGPDLCNETGACVGDDGPATCLANNCSPSPGQPPDLTCWLNDHPKIRDAIIWMSSGSIAPWTAWTPQMKQQLQQAFEDSWQWFDSGMTNYPGTIPPDPPVNQEELLGQCMWGRMVVDSQTAWNMYLAHLGHTLAGDIGDWIPWSLCDFGAGSQRLNLLLDSRSLFYFSDSAAPGYTVRDFTPAHPTYTFSFLVNNGILGNTRLETIAGMLDWARGMQHLPGGCDTYCAYQICGLTVSKVIEGTFLSEEPYSTWLPDLEHYTHGCGGTASFFKAVLRTANIPVNRVSNTGCGHVQVQFPSEGLFLSHGDDPYSWFQDSDPAVTPPMEDMLLDQTTYSAWFNGIKEDSCDNIGRRVAELAIEWLPNKMVNQYCLDVWKIQINLINDHSEGSIALDFEGLYTYQELVDMNLYGRLSDQATALGYWCGGM
jgi:hypothetical protein